MISQQTSPPFTQQFPQVALVVDDATMNGVVKALEDRLSKPCCFRSLKLLPL